MAHLFVFFEVATPGKRLIAVLARVRVGVSGVGGDGCGCGGCCGGGGGRGVRRRRTVTVVAAVVVLTLMVVAVDRGARPAVGRGAAVRRRVVLRHGRAPRRRGLFGAHLAGATQRF